MRVLFAAILTLLLAGCIDFGTDTNSPVKEAKVCKYVDEATCNADVMCGWDKYGGADNTGKCKDKAKIKPADPHAAPVVN